MSLVGNLEDLSLGDIMQIISLSQKSGVLALKGDRNSGRIVFRLGLVHAACVKGQPDDLRGALVGAGLIEGSAFDEFAARAQELGLPIEELIGREGGPSTEQIDALLRKSVEAAIVEMFSWPSGDFSFDVRSKLDHDDPRLLLSSGINAQYLAMEGLRISDERLRDESRAAADSDDSSSELNSSPSADDLFADPPPQSDPNLFNDDPEVVGHEASAEMSAADVIVATVVSREDEDPGLEPQSDGVVSTPAADTQHRPSAAAAPEAVPQNSGTRMTPVVMIDPDVAVLGWVKSTIQDDFIRVHVFQQADLGLARIRQYLIRGELPVVLISTQTRVDPLSGIRGITDFVNRLKKQAARLVVIGLHEVGTERRSAMRTAFDGVLFRPGGGQLRETGDSVISKPALEFASALHQILADRSAADGVLTARPTSAKSASVRDLRDATAKLQKASTRGVILPVVLDFASELFSRVAILIVREDRVFAIAGRGITALEADPLDSSPPVPMQALDNGWIRTVLQSGEPVQGPPTTAADRALLARMGGIEPAVAYFGPIESGGSTIALLYGDQSPGGAEMPDTSGLEVVLHHAGLALDRAALERALWEADARQR